MFRLFLNLIKYTIGLPILLFKTVLIIVESNQNTLTKPMVGTERFDKLENLWKTY